MWPSPDIKSSCATGAVTIWSVTDTLASSSSASISETPKRCSSYLSFRGEIKALVGVYLTFSIKVCSLGYSLLVGVMFVGVILNSLNWVSFFVDLRICLFGLCTERLLPDFWPGDLAVRPPWLTLLLAEVRSMLLFLRIPLRWERLISTAESFLGVTALPKLF